MPKFKKTDDYYSAQDFSLKLAKGAVFKIVAGTPLVWTKTNYVDGIAASHNFEFRNTPFSIEAEDGVVSEFVVGFGEEAQRAAGMKNA
jgi:hypothetical protein